MFRISKQALWDYVYELERRVDELEQEVEELKHPIVHSPKTGKNIDGVKRKPGRPRKNLDAPKRKEKSGTNKSK